MPAKILRPFLCLWLVVCASCISRLPKNIVRENNIEYARVGEQSLLLDLYRPKNATAKLPVVVWIHGGSWREGSKDRCPIGFMAAQNFAIVSLNYRLTTAAPFPAQIHDCKAAIRWLRANAVKYNFDADHIGIFGASAGGHLAALLGTTEGVPALEGNIGDNLDFSSRVQAVCAFYPPTDLDRMAIGVAARTATNTAVAHLLGGSVESSPAQVRLATPMTYVNKNAAPFFLLHGDKDRLVPVEQSEIFHQALLRAGAESHLIIVPGKGHGITAPPAAAKEIYDFLQRHLRPGN